MWEDADAKPGQPADKPEPEPQPKDSAKPEKQGKQDSEVVELKKQFEALRKERDELAASERYWAEQARGKGKPTEADPEPELDDDETELDGDTPDKQFEEFSAKGVEALVKRGLLTKKAAREIIRKEAQRIAEQVTQKHVSETVAKLQRQQSADMKLAGEFPDLQKEDSDLFKRTREIYREMVADDPALKQSPNALRMAARTAKAELQAVDRDRRERIARQGEPSSRNGGFAADNDDGLSPAQRKIIEAFNRDGGTLISEESYLKRAKDGVNMAAKNYQPGKVDWR